MKWSFLETCDTESVRWQFWQLKTWALFKTIFVNWLHSQFLWCCRWMLSFNFHSGAGASVHLLLWNNCVITIHFTPTREWKNHDSVPTMQLIKSIWWIWVYLIQNNQYLSSGNFLCRELLQTCRLADLQPAACCVCKKGQHYKSFPCRTFGNT